MMRKIYTLNDGRKLIIRQMVSNDKEPLTKLYEEMSVEPSKLLHLPNNQELFQKFRFPDYFISIVTEHEGKIIGYGEIIKDSEKKNGDLQIFIHKNYQRVGLGTSMMIILLREATRQKLHRINLKVTADNEAAIRLFRKFEFRQELIKKESFSTREIHDTIHMTRILN
jgi:RimJ/RimL family protein N-acetyltransferase